MFHKHKLNTITVNVLRNIFEMHFSLFMKNPHLFKFQFQITDMLYFFLLYILLANETEICLGKVLTVIKFQPQPQIPTNTTSY